MSWTPPKLSGNLSDHVLPRGWWEHHNELDEPHTSEQLKDWFDEYHKCIKCGKVIKTHQQAGVECKDLTD